jgi:hypothetical protein
MLPVPDSVKAQDCLLIKAVKASNSMYVHSQQVQQQMQLQYAH